MMRTNPSIYFCLALLAIGIGGSSCVSKCDLNPSLCETRPVELSVHKLDIGGLPQTGNTLSIHIPGDLLDGTKIARLLAPQPANPEQLQFADMPLTAENEPGYYKISIDSNIAKLQAGCTYYLDLFVDDPKYQIVKDICSNQLNITSGKLTWAQIPYKMQFAPNSPIDTGTRGIWIYNSSVIILQQPSKPGSMLRSHYSALKWSNTGLTMTGVDLNIASFAHFRNGQGIVADYDSDLTSPDLYLYAGNAQQFTINSTMQALTGFGKFTDLAMDISFKLVVAVSANGTLTSWDFPANGVARKFRNISGPQITFSKVAVIKRDNGELSDLISFDTNGAAHVFLQQSDGNFKYDTDLSRARADLGTGLISALAVGDVDGDAMDDIAIVRQIEPRNVIFYLNKGDGSFRKSPSTLSVQTNDPNSTISAISIGPTEMLKGSKPNNLVVLDNNAWVYIYQNQTNETCPLNTIACSMSPATMNAP